MTVHALNGGRKMASIDTVMLKVLWLLVGLSVIAMAVSPSYPVIGMALLLIVVANGIGVIGVCGGFRDWDKKRQ